MNTKVFNSKKPCLGSKHGAEPATLTSTSTSTLKTGTADLMPSALACDGTANAQVIPGVNVSIQPRPSYLYVFAYYYRVDRS